MKHNCNICGYPADVSQLHPNSLELPTDGGNYSVAHTGCANGEMWLAFYQWKAAVRRKRI